MLRLYQEVAEQIYQLGVTYSEFEVFMAASGLPLINQESSSALCES